MKVLITGGTNGMGKGVAKVLASADHQSHEIIILCRSEELGLKTIHEIKSLTSNDQLSLVICDLMKLGDVKNAIEVIQRKHDYLDAIFINAGIGYAEKRIESKEGVVAHFQVNYLSQFMLTLNMLQLLEKSEAGGRIIFNATRSGEIFWDDLQMNNKWSYEAGIHQAMVAKRMLLSKLHSLYKDKKDVRISFVGFEISETVWTNQIQIIPFYMKAIASIMRLFGTFISIEKCGEIIVPLLIEKQEESLKRSGKFITWKKNNFVDLTEETFVLNPEMQNKLWQISLDLCSDELTTQISETLHKAE